jgi:hypothetical protein
MNQFNRSQFDVYSLRRLFAEVHTSRLLQTSTLNSSTGVPASLDCSLHNECFVVDYAWLITSICHDELEHSCCLSTMRHLHPVSQYSKILLGRIAHCALTSNSGVYWGTVSVNEPPVESGDEYTALFARSCGLRN